MMQTEVSEFDYKKTRLRKSTSLIWMRTYPRRRDPNTKIF